jgi:conjugative relaxase-like TrwC/TraI family protein
MFTAKPQKNRNAATQYFDEHLSQNDYYTEQQAPAGYWIGQGAEKLGLKNESAVTRESFLRLCDNQHPETGAKLTQIQLSERRVFFDFTCSASKSVSIMAVTMSDSRIVQAHERAASTALKELEAFAATRVRKSGAMEDRTTGNLIGAAFQHTSSRALDPQLHTHFTLFNATFDQKEQKWKALQTSEMFGAIHYGTAVYRNELARRLHELGYKTRTSAHGFEIDGVSPKLILRFSKRAQQRNALVAKKEKQLGRKLTNDEISHVVHQSRPQKQKNVSDQDVRKGQLGEIGFFEKRQLRALMAQADGQWKHEGEKVTAADSVKHAVEHVFARQSVAPEHKLLEAALIKSCGQVQLKEVKIALGTGPELVRVGQEFSTEEILRSELSLIRTVNEGLNAVAPISPRFEISAALGHDQQEALKLVLSSSDRVSGFRGLAGSGKTTTLQELQRALVTAGLTSVFCAPTASATEVLRKDGFSDACTIAKLLQSNTLPRKSVIVVDEAGFVGTGDMERLFELGRKNETRFVFVGDTGQHAAVARGDALRIIEAHSGYRFGQLAEIRRQKTAEFRAVVALAANHQTGDAFSQLQQQGLVIEHEDSGALYQKAADAYLQVTEQGKAALLVSPTWAEIESVTAAVRAQLREHKKLGAKDEKIQVFDSLNWTDAQKKLVPHYEDGMQLRFVKSTAQFKAGETVEVASCSGKQLRVRDRDGQERIFQPGRSPSSFEVGQNRELAVAVGETLLLRANAPGFVNGERVRVKSVHHGTITLTDDRVLYAGYRAFTHGYAVTSHAAQGKTVDEVMMVASSRSFAAVSREQFYVSISRAKERVRIYTDDAGLLRDRVQDSHTRKAAIELAGFHEALQQSGFKRMQEPPNAPPLRTEPTRTSVAQSVIKVWRQVRALRLDRLAPKHRLADWNESFRQWLGRSRRVDQVQAMPRRETTREQMTIRPEGPHQSRGMRL